MTICDPAHRAGKGVTVVNHLHLRRTEEPSGAALIDGEVAHEAMVLCPFLSVDSRGRH